MNKTALGFIAATVVVFVGGWLLLREREVSPAGPALLVYCAAGVRPPVAKTAEEYEAQYGARAEIQYGGSSTLLAQIDTSKQGDLYVAADHGYMEQAARKGLIDETLGIAWQRPVLAVRQGNPKKIRGVDDLLRDDVRVALATEGAAIGEATKDILDRLGLWQKVSAREKAEFPTVTELADSIKLDALDAGIVWDATVRQMGGLEMVELPKEVVQRHAVEIAVLRSTRDAARALRFARYLTARDKGLVNFSKEGYEVVDGDPWAEKPRIIVYCGGVLRPAVQPLIEEFQAREGVSVETQFNGCGILVGSMKAGNWPDGYMACDVSFMEPVRSRFADLYLLSSTRIVMITPKGNPKGIRTLADLGKPGIKVGLASEEKSTLGALTRGILEDAGVYSKVRPNAVADAPTADLLVNDLLVGALDAAIVYYANVSRHQGKLDIVELEGVRNATATQPSGLYKEARYPILTTRLLKRIQASPERFKDNGFDWIGRAE